MAETRNRGFLNEISEIEKQDAADKARREWEGKAGERRIAAQQAAADKRELRRALIIDPRTSLDFSPTPYDGHFGDATPTEITKAIQENWNVFVSAHPELSKEELSGLTLFLRLHPNADVSRNAFEEALTYVNGRMMELEPQPEPASVPVHKSDKTETVNPFRAGSREYENFDREKYRAELKRETTLGTPIFDETVQDIVDSTGKRIAGSNILSFRSWLDAPVQKRLYPFTREGIRLGFAKYFGTTEHCTQQELDDIRDAKALEALSAREYARVVSPNGVINTGADPSNSTYRARR